MISQWSANLYLSGLDHYVLRSLKIGAYQRYMDDLTLFGHDAAALHAAAAAIGAWLVQERRLQLHPGWRAVPAASPSDYLGFRVDPRGLSMGRKARRRLRDKVRRAAAAGPEALEATLMAYRGIALFG